MTVLWTLDTCGFDIITDNCQIEYDSDLSFIRYVRKCPAHANIPSDATGFNQVAEENRRGPGNTFWTMLQNAPTSLFDVQNDGTRTFKRGINVSWSWTGTTPNRVLNITISGITLTTNQQNNIRNAVDNRFGAGKVVITFG